MSKHKTVIWDSCVGTSDALAGEVAGELRRSDSIVTGNSLVVDYARLMMLRGEISGLVLVVGDKRYVVNQWANFNPGDYPEVLLSSGEIATLIISAQMKMRKARRSK